MSKRMTDGRDSRPSRGKVEEGRRRMDEGEGEAREEKGSDWSEVSGAKVCPLRGCCVSSFLLPYPLHGYKPSPGLDAGDRRYPDASSVGLCFGGCIAYHRLFQVDRAVIGTDPVLAKGCETRYIERLGSLVPGFHFLDPALALAPRP